MDWQKNLLIAAMVAVFVTLMFRWFDFVEERQPDPGAAPVVTPSSPQIPQLQEEGSFIPTVAEEEEDERPARTEDTSISREYIRVLTDTLDLLIDPYGGDIIHLALPKHAARLDTPDVPFILLNNTEFHTYVAQSGLVGPNGTDTAEGRPLFRAERTEYRLDNNDQLEVDLVYEQSADVTITKRFRFTRGEYLIDIEYLIDNRSDQPWRANLYGQTKRDSLNHNPSTGGFFTLNPYLGAALTTEDTRYKKISFSDIREAREELSFSTQGGWMAMVQHYFVSSWVPNQEATNQYRLRHLPREGSPDLFLLSFTSPRTQVAPGEQGLISTQFYAGPKYTKRLAEIARYLNLTVDYGFLWWLATPLFSLLYWLHSFLNNWGLAIIALTIIVKAIFFPLSAASFRSMAKMRKLSPKIMEMKERYGDDRQRMSQEMMKLYKKEKVNPLGGCLPVLIQMPVFLALYWTLMESVELRHAPFFGWIVDMSVRDPLFILPLLMGATMFIQFRLNPTPPDPTQAKVMKMMPFIFTLLFLMFPAGLVLYWVTNNVLSIAQQWMITRQIEQADTKKA